MTTAASGRGKAAPTPPSFLLTLLDVRRYAVDDERVVGEQRKERRCDQRVAGGVDVPSDARAKGLHEEVYSMFEATCDLVTERR